MASLSFSFWRKTQEHAHTGMQHSGEPARQDASAPQAQVVAQPRPPKITRIEQIPAWTSTRTAPGGSIALSAEDRRCVAVLETAAGAALILYAQSTRDWHRALGSIQARLRQDGMGDVRTIEVTTDILSIVYDAAAASRVQMDVGDSDQGKLFNDILEQAIKAGASDIHMQVGRLTTRILLRVNGDLTGLRTLSASAGQRLGRAIFALADASTKGVDFNPAQFQDAKITREVRVDGKATPVQLRFVVTPAYPEGFDVTLRVLRSGVDLEGWRFEALGYDAIQVSAIGRILARPTGAIVLCGATGSGKSTTLATCCMALNERYQGRRLIRTIEDPPEFDIPDARQIPVVRDADGVSDGFGRALRAAMRADPDILLVGEVRDEDTARLAMEAVMTGHKLLTTVHAASPFDALDRLIDKGFRRQIVAADDIISGVIYQRLIPVLCLHCAIDLDRAREDLPADHVARVQRYFPGDIRDARYRGCGCEACNNTGIAGRTVAAAMLMPDREIRARILADDRVTASAYWRSNAWAGAYEVNGRTALDQGVEKMAQGLVSPLDVEHDLGDLDSQESREDSGEWLGRQQRHLQVIR